MLLKLRDQLRSGSITPAEIFQALEERILVTEPQLGAYLHYLPEQREIACQAAEAALREHPDAPLAALPIGIKDAIAVANQPLSCASRILEGYESPYHATVVERLTQAGAVPFGRMNMDEFAMGATGLNSAFTPTRNPHGADFVSGGSSSGSAAAVAAGSALAALGSDTGGSIRQPASFCGIVGLKPTYGRFSRYGLTAFASSLDQIGPMTSCVEDAAFLYDLLAGYDPRDTTSLPKEIEPTLESTLQAAASSNLQGLRIGYAKEHFTQQLEEPTRLAIQAAFKQLEELGAELVEISLPRSEYAVATYYTLACAEASANLARFDGVRYGKRVEGGEDQLDALEAMYRQTRSQGFGAEVKRRILLGTFVLSSGHYDAWYVRAQKIRTLMREDFNQAFAQCDLIAGPTAPTTAFPMPGTAAAEQERAQDMSMKHYLSDIYTVPANLAGLPGISLPCGLEQVGEGVKLPVGLQLLAPSLQEKRLLTTAAAFQASTNWQKEFAPESLVG